MQSQASFAVPGADPPHRIGWFAPLGLCVLGSLLHACSPGGGGDVGGPGGGSGVDCSEVAGPGGSGGASCDDAVNQANTCEVKQGSTEHSTVRAIAHSFVGEEGTTTPVVYRVTVDPWDIVPNGKDNGFYYQVTTMPQGTTQTVVPFNGFRVNEGGTTQVPAFSFFTQVDHSETDPASTTLLVKACANYVGGTQVNGLGGAGGTGGGAGGAGGDACNSALWTDTYDGLPDVWPTPQCVLDGLNSTWDFTLSPVVANTVEVDVPNTGVAAGLLTVTPSAGWNSSARLEWLENHLVFVTKEGVVYQGSVYPNDVLARTEVDEAGGQTTVLQSVGVLPVEQGAACTTVDGGKDCWLRYTTTSQIGTAVKSTDTKLDYLVYSTGENAQRQSLGGSLTLGAGILSDSPTLTDQGCLYWKGSAGCGPKQSSANTGTLDVAPWNLEFQRSINDAKSQASGVTVNYRTRLNGTSQEAWPGSAPTRQIYFTQASNVSATCSKVVNPLSTEGLGPNYLIRLDASLMGTNGPTHWPVKPNNSSVYPDGLYYVLPSGYGVCKSSAPFCENVRQGRGNYVPRYTVVGGDQEGCNEDAKMSEPYGGGTENLVVDCTTFADQYTINDDTAQSENTFVFFDNCGWGHSFEETSAQGRLPPPPFPNNMGAIYENYAYTVTNDHEYPVVFSKECCASWFQALPSGVTSVDSNAKDISATRRPPSMKDTYGTFLMPGQSMRMTTVYLDQTYVVYHALTGDALYKLRLYWADYVTAFNSQWLTFEPIPVGAPYLYACENQKASIKPGSPGTVTLGSGELDCNTGNAAVRASCPWGTSVVSEGAETVCEALYTTMILGIPEWASQFGTDPIGFWGVGAPGDNGDGAEAKGGAAGYAATVLSAADLAAYRGLVALNGQTGAHVDTDDRCGGSSTTLFAHSALDAFSSGPGTPPDELILVAGGGGAASNGTSCVPGENGGRAGIYATNGVTFNTPNGGNGADGSGHSGNPGKGASGGKGGDAGNGAGAGGDGVGGVVANCQGWYAAGTAPYSLYENTLTGEYRFGDGGRQSDDCGAWGGAGYGGGGGGHGECGSCNKPGSAGGGGSFAKAPTATDPSFDVSSVPPELSIVRFRYTASDP